MKNNTPFEDFYDGVCEGMNCTKTLKNDIQMAKYIKRMNERCMENWVVHFGSIYGYVYRYGDLRNRLDEWTKEKFDLRTES